MSYVPLTFSRWLAVMMDDLQKDYDVVICVDSTAQSRHGPVGVGKTNLAYIIAKAMNWDFDLKRDMVIKDDLDQAQQMMVDRRAYKICWFDEAEWFFFLQWWQKSRIRAMTPEFMSNRKERRIWILNIPVIWGAVWFMTDYRIQWRVRMKDRYSADVFMRSGIPSKRARSHDWWGSYRGTITEIPKVPDRDWGRYEDLVFAHPSPCERGRCISAEPGGRSG